LNKGEARNALARAVSFHRLGRLRDRGAEGQGHRASGLALVTAAIALWNSVYLERALEALRRRGEAVPDALLGHLAPPGWQHINPDRSRQPSQAVRPRLAMRSSATLANPTRAPSGCPRPRTGRERVTSGMR